MSSELVAPREEFFVEYRLISKPPPPPLLFGPLPTESIKLTIGIDLDPGDVVFTVPYQHHVQKNHPDDYGICLPHVASIIANPPFIGDDFRNTGIELISRITALGSPMLVAVNIDPRPDGTYEIASFYPISEKKIEARVAKGFLKRTQNR